MKNKFLLFGFLFLVSCMVAAAPPKKVACVGNSITFGAFMQNGGKSSYPAQLQAYLGNEYDVQNFGVSGCTALNNGDHPYVKSDAYSESLAFQPDIVLIKLGTNDTKPQNWKFKEQLKNDYLNLVNAYRNLPSKPRVILLTPVQCFLDRNAAISDSIMRTSIIPIIKEVAYEENLEIINMRNLFGDKWVAHWMPDRLHPSSIGAGMMAQKIDGYLSVENGKSVTETINRFPIKAAEEFNFHGYKGYKYNNDGVAYYIVEPHRLAIGNPWVWRARFWGHEPQVDVELLERGFYLTYCDVSDLYGSDKAVSRWNVFYKLAVKAGLNKKVVLEGMSRGGLIIYNWAANNPGKVACIYADAPVMDIKSWPMGKGNSKGSKEETGKMLSAYGFADEEQALTWKHNPIDHAAVLAKAKIPMIHVVGNADVVVPVAENTEVFAKRLADKGCNLTIIHKPQVGHHPHSLYNPQSIVRFILKSTGRIANECVRPICGNEFRAGAGWSEGADWHIVAEDIQATLEGKKLKLLMLGNSITQGFGGNRKSVVAKPGKAAMDEIVGVGNWESAGISGDRTQNLLWRIKNDGYNKCRPEVVMVTIGVNNLLAGDAPADVAAGIVACAVEARKQFPESRIVLLGLLPTGKEKENVRRLACDEIHTLLSKAKIKGVEYVNPTPWFTHRDGSLITELYGDDFIHLTSIGYRIWSKEIAKILSSQK